MQAASPSSEVTAPTSMKSLRSALRVLTEFTDGQVRYTVTELANRTGLTMSHTSKILAALCDAGLVTRDPSSQSFSVAVKSFVLGSQFFNHDVLSREALSVLRRLTEETQHSTRVSVLDGDKVVYLIGVSGPLFLDSPWRMGTYLRIHSTSAGRVFLAFMDEALSVPLMRELPLEAMTETTITCRAEFQSLIERVRRQGFAVSRNENTPNLSAIAVPVFDAAQRAVCVLSVTFPSHKVSADDEHTLLLPLQRAASTLSLRLGCPAYPFGPHA